MPIPRPNINTFFFESQEDNTRFTAYFGDGAAIVTDGYGGWSVTGRPKNIGLTEWQGRNPIAVEIPFVIDNYSFGQATVRGDNFGGFAGPDEDPDELARCNATEDMAHKLGTLCGLGDSEQPPILRVQGHGGIPHDDTIAPGAHFWVIESVTWDRDVEIRSGMYRLRLRCGGLIVIRQYKTANDILRRLGAKNRARKPEIYIVHKGDTLQKIAAAKYHNANKWKIIADANGLRDPRSLKIGMHLRIPR
jgi:hypothetical protein